MNLNALGQPASAAEALAAAAYAAARPPRRNRSRRHPGALSYNLGDRHAAVFGVSHLVSGDSYDPNAIADALSAGGEASLSSSSVRYLQFELSDLAVEPSDASTTSWRIGTEALFATRCSTSSSRGGR